MAADREERLMGDRVRFVSEDGSEGPWIDRGDVDAMVDYMLITGALGIPQACMHRVRAALPPVPWEPSDELIEALCASYDYSVERNRSWAVATFKRIHKAGVFAAWDRMQETDR